MECFMDEYLEAAIKQAKQGMEMGGLPVGSVLVVDGAIVGRGHNRTTQLKSVIRHAELDCIDNAGELTTEEYQRSVLYTTLSSCDMCSGAIIFFKIPKVVIGDSVNYQGAEPYLKTRGVSVEVLNDETCIQMMHEFLENNPGVLDGTA